LRVKLKHIDMWIAQRKQIAHYYLKNINNKKILLPKLASDCGHVWHIFAIRTKNRDEFGEYLSKNGIGTLIHYPIPIHLQEAYEDLKFGINAFPIAEKIANEVLSLPLWVGIKGKDLAYICDIINKF